MFHTGPEYDFPFKPMPLLFRSLQTTPSMLARRAADRQVSSGGFASMKSSAAIRTVNPVARVLSLLWLYAKMPLLLRRVRRHTIEHVDGVSIIVWPDVLNPVVFRSGELFARAIGSEGFAEP